MRLNKLMQAHNFETCYFSKYFAFFRLSILKKDDDEYD